MTLKFPEEFIERSIKKSAEQGHTFTSEERKIFEDTIEKINQGKSITEALKIPPEVVDQMINQAKSLMQQEQYENALTFFLFLNRIDLYHFEYAFSAGMCYSNLKRYKEAIPYFVLAKDLAPSNPNPSYNIAYCFAQMGDQKIALNILEELIESFDSKQNEKLLEKAKEFYYYIKNQ